MIRDPSYQTALVLWPPLPLIIHLRGAPIVWCSPSWHSSWGQASRQLCVQNMSLVYDHPPSRLLHLGSPDGLIENILQTLLGERWALQIPNSIDLLSSLHTLRVGDWCHPLLTKPLCCLRIITKIQLSTDKDYRNIGCVVGNLWEPLEIRLMLDV